MCQVKYSSSSLKTYVRTTHTIYLNPTKKKDICGDKNKLEKKHFYFLAEKKRRHERHIFMKINLFFSETEKLPGILKK